MILASVDSVQKQAGNRNSFVEYARRFRSTVFDSIQTTQPNISARVPLFSIVEIHTEIFACKLEDEPFTRKRCLNRGKRLHSLQVVLTRAYRLSDRPVCNCHIDHTHLISLGSRNSTDPLNRRVESCSYGQYEESMTESLLFQQTQHSVV